MMYMDIKYFQYFVVFEEYRALCGDSIAYIDHQSPEKQQNHIFEMLKQMYHPSG